MFKLFSYKHGFIAAALTFVVAMLLDTAVYAKEDFSADYSINYNVDQSGTTEVTHKVKITNQKSDVIATSYTLSLNQVDAYDIIAQDENDTLDITQKKDGDITIVEIKLKSFVIGEGRQTSIVVNYKSKQIAIKTGEIWTITIPRAQSAIPSSSYNISLSVPETFGPEIFITPSPSIRKNDKQTYTYEFANEQLKDSNISASYGKYQIYNFKLRYQLHNANKFSGNYEIALPPDIVGSQVVKLENLTPKPKNTYQDTDGNLIAVYGIKSGQQLEVVATGATKITSKQISPTAGSKITERSAEKRYTKPEKYWQTTDKNVQMLANKLLNNNQTVLQNAQNIYKYLIDNYSYDFEISKKDFVNRQGAAKALVDKIEWGCMEFTDSFIALARAMGIPAREINGFALTDSSTNKPITVSIKSGDLLHSWPEFYDNVFGWVQIDPTWGDTSGSDYFSKLDTSHIVFVIKGSSSEHPYPAGTYRTSDSEKLVDISVASEQNSQAFVVAATAKRAINLNIFQLLRGNRAYKITNSGNVTLYYNTKNVVLPEKTTTIYIPRNQSEIQVSNALGESATVKL